MLASRDYDGRTMAWDEELEKKVSALTADDVAKAVRGNIDLAQISIVKAGDFKKVSK
jgi:zinc protease